MKTDIQPNTITVTQDQYNNRKTFIQVFLVSYSEAFASELLENLKEIIPSYLYNVQLFDQAIVLVARELICRTLYSHL